MGSPKFLHPTTANKTNLEMANVFTMIDPRKPLPEVVNVQFESEEISRVLLSSPWMPLICDHCKEVGHNLKRCKKAPILCTRCNSTTHEIGKCSKPTTTRKKNVQSRRIRLKDRDEAMNWQEKPKKSEKSPATLVPMGASTLGRSDTVLRGESSGLTDGIGIKEKSQGNTIRDSPIVPDVEEDSSDIDSSDSQNDSSESSDHQGYLTVVAKKKMSKGARGNSPKTT